MGSLTRTRILPQARDWRVRESSSLSKGEQKGKGVNVGNNYCELASGLTNPRLIPDLLPFKFLPTLLAIVEEKENHCLKQRNGKLLGAQREAGLEREGEKLVPPVEEATLVGRGVKRLEAVESGLKLKRRRNQLDIFEAVESGAPTGWGS